MDVGYPPAARFQVIATGEPAEACGYGHLRLVIEKERAFSIQLEAIRHEPSHPGIERHESDLTASLAKNRAPAVTPSTRQAARPAPFTKGSLLGAKRRRDAQDDRRAEGENRCPAEHDPNGLTPALKRAPR